MSKPRIPLSICRPAHCALGVTLTLLMACSAGPRLETPETPPGAGTPKVLVDGGLRTASPREYRAWVEEQVQDPDARAMLNKLLKVSQTITDNRMISDNDARLLVDGPGTFREMFKDIDAAQRTIHLETFILEDDEVGRALTERLIAASRRGVKVRVLLDAFGCLELPEAFIEDLRRADLEVRKFHPLDPTEDPRIWRSNNRNHRKILIVDGQVAYTGGINFSGVYSEGSFSVSRDETKEDGAWRDTHVRLVGPVVHQFQRSFLDLWNKDLPSEEQLSGDEFLPEIPAQGKLIAGVVESEGGDDEESDIYSVIAAAIGHARQRVWITQAYFAPDEALLEIIAETAERGVDVRLLLPGVSDAPILVQASRSSYERLLKAGVRIYERPHSPLHAKTMVVDGVWSTIGSSNFDYRSFVDNYELNAVIVGGDFGKAMEKLYQVDLQQAEEITLQAWRKRPIIQRMKETVGDMLRRWL